jgi:hypothetical protein
MAQVQFTVTVNDDGSISTAPVSADENVARQANTFDIYQAAKEIVSEIDNQLLADRIAKIVVARMQPVDASAEIKSKIIDALSDRGIETPLN